MFHYIVALKETRLVVLKAVMLLLSLAFYSTYSGHSDLGFRAQVLELKLAQKFPPAIALEIVDSFEEKPIENTTSSNKNETIKTVYLSVGQPDIKPVQLDVMTFGEPKVKSLYPKLPSSSPLSVESYSSVENSETNLADSNDFTEEEKMRLRISGLDRNINLKDFAPAPEKSFKDRIQDIIRRENLNLPEENNLASEPLNKEAKPNYGANPSYGAKPNNGTNPSNNSTAVNKNDNTASTPYQKESLSNNSISIRGDIEFSKEGRLYFNNHTIDVRRYEEGTPKEIARVDLANGTFSVEVKNTKGYLLGRLINSQGRVEGEGTVAISDLIGSQKAKLILKEKSFSGSTINPTSVYGGQLDPSMLLAGGSSENQISKMNLDPGSEFIIDANAKNHRHSVAAINYVGGKSDLFLLPDKMVKGLIDIFYEMGVVLDLSRGDSMIYGQVLYKGRPAEGVSVISGQGQTGYFGSLYLPEPGRSKTSENGIFVTSFNNTVHPTWNEIYLGIENGRGVYVNTLAYPGKITQVLAEIPSEAIPLTLRSFDAFSGEPVRVQAEIQQMGEIFDTGMSGSVELEVPRTNTLSYVLVNPDAPYEKLRLSYTNILDYIHIPLVTKEWIDNIKGTYKVNYAPRAGAVLGFVQGDDFTVDIPNKGSETRIVYFDPQGFIVPKGIAGGGFIAFNIDEDLANIIIISQEAHREAARIIRPDNDYIQVVNIGF